MESPASEASFRPMTRDDAAAVNELLAVAESVDHTDEHYNLEDVLEDYANPMIDPSRDWVLVECDGELVGHGVLWPRAVVDGAVLISIDGTVRPSYRRRGIGTALVSWLVARAREYAAERDARPEVIGSAPSDNTDLAAVFGEHGLKPERWEFVMSADLSAPAPAVAVPDGYTLRTWADADPDQLRRTHNAAFVDHYGFTPWSPQMWEQMVTSSRNSRPRLSLLLTDASGAPAAYLQTMEYDAVAQTTGIREAYVAKVGTVPAHRRRGLAAALLGIALATYREEGFDRATLNVDSENPTGALGVYERVGFRVDRRWTNYRLMD